MGAYGEVGVWFCALLTLVLGGGDGQLRTVAAFLPVKSLLYMLIMRPVMSQIGCGHFGEGKNLLPMLGNQIPFPHCFGAWYLIHIINSNFSVSHFSTMLYLVLPQYITR